MISAYDFSKEWEKNKQRLSKGLEISRPKINISAAIGGERTT